jgi:hypothetical protein
MAYVNNDRKFVAVINRKQPLPIAMNALAHSSLGICGKLLDIDHLLDYPNESSGFLAKISEFPFIILEAKNGNQIKTLMESVKMDSTLFYNVFTTSMIGASAAEQIAATAVADGVGLEFVTIVLFGDREKIDPLTKKFSLLK